MNNISLFPIGTIVSLKDGLKKIMIIGFYPFDKNNNTTHEYSGCLYPEGFMSNNKLVVFNHNQIEKVYYRGFSDQDEIEFKQYLNSVLVNRSGKR